MKGKSQPNRHHLTLVRPLKGWYQCCLSTRICEAIDLVNSGKADVTLNSQDSWGVYKKAHPETKLKAKVTKTLDNTSSSPMLNKKDKALAKKITKAQKQLAKDGTLSDLSEKYFDSDLTKKP